jgi:hypothetical protein
MPTVDRTYPLSAVPTALQHLQEGMRAARSSSPCEAQAGLMSLNLGDCRWGPSRSHKHALDPELLGSSGTRLVGKDTLRQNDASHREEAPVLNP